MTRAEQLKALGYIVKPCKGCGKMMVWAKKPGSLEDREYIPLDPVPPTYTVIKCKEQDGSQISHAVRTLENFVSHFVTCPARDQFKKKVS
jgi:hypothetical protein